MSDPVRFLTAMAQAIATMSLYSDLHPSRERALDAAYGPLAELQSANPRQSFTFLGDEVVHGTQPVHALRGWEWSARLVAAGVQRLEFDEEVSREELEGLLDELLARMTLSAADSPELRQMRRTRIRLGMVGVRGDTEDPAATVATLDYSLAEEIQAIRWLHSDVEARRPVPVAEAEAVVRSLSVAMHGDQQMILPLLRLRDHDEYTTTHSMNVAVLTMALSEFLGYPQTDVRAFGVAGLLHDIGKVRIPRDILNKPGKLTAEERAIINQHPVDGARLLLDTERNLDTAAIVAYEHHLMHDGGGYPALHYCRACHSASRLAHVCDVYDALRTHRPYRAAWTSARVLQYIRERAGTEFDPEVAQAFVNMMTVWDQRFAVLEDERQPVRAPVQAAQTEPQPADAACVAPSPGTNEPVPPPAGV
ncbi:MAG TPA: HD domain-containing phosphohydrolase [Longimicrobium sp.]|jgi:putative nucleotidyltransferase with HDIG domain|uniref:HD-GYP domain-containing protein n=1 Tax=Longimicrobium sp. TaxID=2029185 RepID=UPI002EDAEC20